MIAAPIIALLLLPFGLAQSTDYGPQLTSAALEIQGAISGACNTTDPCKTFVGSVIPRCQRLQGDPGCWCGNHDPLHFCAICMSNPTDNRTSPDQTAAAIEGHQKYHMACNAWETALNASATATGGASNTASASNGQSSASITSTPGGGSKTPIGAIVGGAVGGVIVLIIGILVLLYWRKQRGSDKIRPSSVSLFSAPASSVGRPFSGYSTPGPQMAYGPSYGAPAMPYNGAGMHSPPPASHSSYSKYPEPMVPG